MTLASAFGLFVTASGVGAATRAQSGSTPGVTGNSVTVGLVTHLTGAQAASYGKLQDAFKARIEAENKKGGVKGRTIRVEVADDASTPAQNLTAAQGLVESKNSFAIVEGSITAFGSARYLSDNGVPTLAFGVDSPVWNQQPNTNAFTIFGHMDPTLSIGGYETHPKFMKSQGAKSAATLAYGSIPLSVAGSNAFESAAGEVGIDVAYANTSLPLGPFDTTSVALGIKDSGADSVYLALAPSGAFTLLAALRQSGADIKVPLSTAAYGSTLLNDPGLVDSAQDTYFAVYQAPYELKTKATKKQQRVLKKYANVEGPLDLQYTAGWYLADLFITGLKAAGDDLTRDSYITALRGVKGWDAGGLKPAPVDMGPFGSAQEQMCWYYVQLSGEDFKPVGKNAVCGDLPPDPYRIQSG